MLIIELNFDGYFVDGEVFRNCEIVIQNKTEIGIF
jgi:hypothetical protein